MTIDLAALRKAAVIAGDLTPDIIDRDSYLRAFPPFVILALLDRLEAAELRIVEAEGLCAREHGLAVVEARKRMQAAEAAVRREHPIMVSMSRLTYEKLRGQFPMEEVQTMQEIIDETRRVAAGKP